MFNKVESLIEDIKDYINACKYQTLSNSRIIVNREELLDLILQLEQSLPEEIDSARKIMNNREQVMTSAKQKAEAMLKEASVQTQQLINEHEIMQQAYAKANEVVSNAVKEAQERLDSATMEANAYKAQAIEYTDNLLANIQATITQTVEAANLNYTELISNLNSTNAIIKENRTELYPPEDDELEDINFDKGDEEQAPLSSGPSII